jgi:DNA-binding MarR family transcriptional regulator
MLYLDLMRTSGRVVSQIAGEFDLSPMQLEVLMLLQSPMWMVFLADSLGCDASNVTGLVDRLEKRGLLTRHVDESDRRAKLISVTQEGAHLRTRLMERLAQPPPFIAGLSREEQRMLAHIASQALRLANQSTTVGSIGPLRRR